MKRTNAILIILASSLLATPALARIKLVALPERQATIIRLDNPAATLIEEERVLTLQKGINKVDFSWKSVSIDADSIRLAIMDHPGQVKLLNVSYPPDEGALVWEIASEGDYAERVRISYLLNYIDRLITYKAVADEAETAVDLKSYVVLRNFSGEDFDLARILLDYGDSFEQGIAHEETKQLLFLKAPQVPIQKVWTFDAALLPWDPEKLNNQNVGIPVSYRLVNDEKSGLGRSALWGGKMRLFQADGSESTIFLGEDNTSLVPVGQKTDLTLGDSRDIVVTQRQMKNDRTNIRKNNNGDVVLYDTNEQITAKIENFKDKPAVLTLIQHIEGQWNMTRCTISGSEATYTKKDARTLVFEVQLAPRTADGPSVQELDMRFQRLNVPQGRAVNLMR
ncbi:MAG: hypothetical protein K9N55_17565 [Phycisphaerae bacterium]|nr:hypothetical protein [Phycisphaerae bacterium]